MEQLQLFHGVIYGQQCTRMPHVNLSVLECNLNLGGKL